MTRLLAAALSVVLAAPALAEGPQHAAAKPAPGSAAAPAAPAPATAPAPAGSAPKKPKELEQAKKLGRQGLVKIAPKLGSRAEKLAREKGGDVVDQAVDLAAEKAGLVPRK